jgi:hypothetical protein
MTSKPVARTIKGKNSSPELERERLAIQDLLAKGEDEHWQIGLHYDRIVNEHLIENSGHYKSPREFFIKHFRDVPASTLRLYGLIAKTFTEDVSKRYGVTKLRALLTYVKSAGSKLSQGDPGNTLITIPQKDRSTKDKRFADCSRSELQDALRHQHEKDAPSPPMDPYDRKILDGIRKAIRDIEGDPPYVTIKTHDEPQDGLVIDFRVPAEHLEDLRDSLVTVLGKESGTAADNGKWNPNWKKVAKLGKTLNKYFNPAPKHKRATKAPKQTRHRARARS